MIVLNYHELSSRQERDRWCLAVSERLMICIVQSPILSRAPHSFGPA
jgi:hypothetical protein